MPLPTEREVFISYGRSDGADYAARLRRRLEKEHPEITLRQDVDSELIRRQGFHPRGLVARHYTCFT